MAKSQLGKFRPALLAVAMVLGIFMLLPLPWFAKPGRFTVGSVPISILIWWGVTILQVVVLAIWTKSYLPEIEE